MRNEALLAPSQLAPACEAGPEGEVIPFDVASAKALAVAAPVSRRERLSILEATGRILSATVRSAIDLPPFDNSAMDGYAVRSADLQGSGPWVLKVGQRVAAGETAHGVAQPGGVAVRILTGAPIPKGFDSVLMQERCERRDDHIIVMDAPRVGQNIRRAGEDIESGQVAAETGAELTPQLLALLAGQGRAYVDVIGKVRVGLLSTGNELRDPGEALGSGQIYNSNRIAIRAALARCAWADVIDFGIVRDRRDLLVDAIGEAAGKCDALITTGGASAGEEDHVAAAITTCGGELDVLKVAMRPGKPVKIGFVGPTLLAALPGNPNAAFVTFRQIAFPALRAMAGLASPKLEWHPGVAGFSYEKRLGHTEFVPVEIVGSDNFGRPVLSMLGKGSSASLRAMSLAQGIARLPPGTPSVSPGDSLQFDRIA
ncbi:MAG: gephyrin-like molybdotransferase Glp [Rhizobiaceae bacterium]